MAIAVEKVKAIYTFIARNLGINTHNALGRKIKTLKSVAPICIAASSSFFLFVFVLGFRETTMATFHGLLLLLNRPPP